MDNEEQELKPGTWQHLFDETGKIINNMAGGHARVVIIIHTPSDQFMVNGQIADTTWLMGMLHRAAKTIDADYQAAYLELREKSRKDAEELNLSTMNVGGGKPQ